MAEKRRRTCSGIRGASNWPRLDDPSGDPMGTRVGQLDGICDQRHSARAHNA